MELNQAQATPEVVTPSKSLLILYKNILKTEKNIPIAPIILEYQGPNLMKERSSGRLLFITAVHALADVILDNAISAREIHLRLSSVK